MKTVLVLEDDLTNLQVFGAVLGLTGYRVLEAKSGLAAIETYKHYDGPVDLFVSDVAVPEMTGTEVALELVRLQPALPVLFVCGTPWYAWDQKDVDNFKQLSPAHVEVLEKPFRPVDFLDKVSEMVL